MLYLLLYIHISLQDRYSLIWLSIPNELRSFGRNNSLYSQSLEPWIGSTANNKSFTRRVSFFCCSSSFPPSTPFQLPGKLLHHQHLRRVHRCCSKWNAFSLLPRSGRNGLDFSHNIMPLTIAGKLIRLFISNGSPPSRFERIYSIINSSHFFFYTRYAMSMRN